MRSVEPLAWPPKEGGRRKKEREGRWMDACVRACALCGGRKGGGGRDGRTDGREKRDLVRSLAGDAATRLSPQPTGQAQDEDYYCVSDDQAFCAPRTYRAWPRLFEGWNSHHFRNTSSRRSATTFGPRGREVFPPCLLRRSLTHSCSFVVWTAGKT